MRTSPARRAGRGSRPRALFLCSGSGAGAVGRVRAGDCDGGGVKGLVGCRIARLRPRNPVPNIRLGRRVSLTSSFVRPYFLPNKAKLRIPESDHFAISIFVGLFSGIFCITVN